MTGTSGRQRANAACLAQYEMVRPPDDLLTQFGRQVATFFRAIKANDYESRTLAALRDALLPKLLSGEIRSAFTASGDLRTRISAFRTDRLGKILANEAPVSLPATPKIVLHLVPLSILDPGAQSDLQPLNQDPNLAAPIQDRNTCGQLVATSIPF